MTTQTREKFATQVNSEVLNRIRDLAEREGRQIHTLVDEALLDLLEKRTQDKPRANVMTAYQASHEKFGTLYKRLAE